MSSTIHAFDLLAESQGAAPPGMCALFGDDAFLKGLALKELLRRAAAGGDNPPTVHDCQQRLPEWRDIADELATNSLFGGGRPRIVILEVADPFVSANRARLEDQAAKTRPGGILVLEVNEWPANTRLYKALDQHGLNVDCRPPQKEGRSKGPDEAAIVKWIIHWARNRHALAITNEGAARLLELTGPVFGMIDQDLAKLALLVPPTSKATAETVQEIIGGWRTKSTWDLVDAAVAGEAGDALTQLDHLLHSGEHPLALVGSLAWSLRRYAAATRLYQQAERSGSRITLREALSKAGLRDWPLGALAAAEKSLIQLGRRRAGQLYRWLLELDLSLKGSHSPEHRARWALEELVLKMAKAPVPSRP